MKWCCHEVQTAMTHRANGVFGRVTESDIWSRSTDGERHVLVLSHCKAGSAAEPSLPQTVHSLAGFISHSALPLYTTCIPNLALAIFLIQLTNTCTVCCSYMLATTVCMCVLLIQSFFLVQFTKTFEINVGHVVTVNLTSPQWTRKLRLMIKECCGWVRSLLSDNTS